MRGVEGVRGVEGERRKKREDFFFDSFSFSVCSERARGENASLLSFLILSLLAHALFLLLLLVPTRSLRRRLSLAVGWA